MYVSCLSIRTIHYCLSKQYRFLRDGRFESDIFSTDHSLHSLFVPDNTKLLSESLILNEFFRTSFNDAPLAIAYDLTAQLAIHQSLLLNLSLCLLPSLQVASQTFKYWNTHH